MTQEDRRLRQDLLSELAYERLLADIIGGRYFPGERLLVDDLASEFGTSRAPVREALQRLGIMGFVVLARQARTTVAFWNADDMRERVEVIGRLASFAALAPHRAASSPPRRPAGGPIESARYFLDASAALVDGHFPRIAQYLRRDFLDPLRLFLEDDTLALHGLNLDLDAQNRHQVADTIGTSWERNDTPALTAALETYADLLADALTLPRPAGPNTSTGSTEPVAPRLHITQ